MNSTPPRKRPPGWLSRHHKHGVRPWRRLRLGFLRWRSEILRNPHTALLYRFTIGGIGSLIVLIGLALVPLPGPGWLIVIIGLIIVSSEFHWAKRILHFVRANVERWTRWVLWQPLWVRSSIAGFTAAGVIVGMWVFLRIVGLPAWVPALPFFDSLGLH